MIKVVDSGIKGKPFRTDMIIYVELSNGDKMRIHKDYLFDNGSIPKICKWLYDTFKIPFLNYKRTAFLVHDYLYNYKGYRTSANSPFKTVSRSFADDEMKYQMKIQECEVWQIRVYYFFVRLLGWRFFGKM